MPIPTLSRAEIQEHTSGGSFERGEQYLADGAVRSVKQTDDHTVKAQVQGSDVHPYLVTIEFDADDVHSVECSCPYFEGTWCKHIVAVMLHLLEDNEVPRTEPAEVVDLIADLDRPALVELVERLVEHDPSLIEQIERERARQSES